MTMTGKTITGIQMMNRLRNTAGFVLGWLLILSFLFFSGWQLHAAVRSTAVSISGQLDMPVETLSHHARPQEPNLILRQSASATLRALGKES